MINDETLMRDSACGLMMDSRFPFSVFPFFFSVRRQARLYRYRGARTWRSEGQSTFRQTSEVGYSKLKVPPFTSDHC